MLCFIAMVSNCLLNVKETELQGLIFQSVLRLHFGGNVTTMLHLYG
jgi:hypothetical protein